MSPDIRRTLADWESWHALTTVSLVVWILARTNRYALLDALHGLVWTAHEILPVIPQARRGQIRPVAAVLVEMWLPLTIASFVCGFFAFHADAESRRRAEGE
ncbi:hypothetical protein ACFQMA_09515 [Halosimplex aquaticum]|uniref:Uncharacterized protein n=1 Tax=Halosimplex aquaticum TaxID=3026162 RepID=A0ABD5XY29_9EURY|nr:hypothetical protein [Halosimplex aquaticum]